MLEIRNLSIELNGRYLIRDLNLTVLEGDKIAIIGEEGNGKSTLLKAIIGKCPYVKVTGSIHHKNIRIGYLAQTIPSEMEELATFSYLFGTMEEYHENVSLYYSILKSLHLPDDFLKEKKVKNLSGGEKVKLQLLKVLLQKPNLLLLDEPSNDLDLSALHELEELIRRTKEPILYVSHDEVLLERTANAILHLEQTKRKTEPKWTFTRVGYQEYVETRLRHIQKTTQVAHKEQQQWKKQKDKLNQIIAKVEYQQNTITRADPHGAKMLKRKMKSARAQERRMNQTELTDTPDCEEAINFMFETVIIPTQKQIIHLALDQLIAGSNVLASSITLELHGPVHIGIIGHNGVGKTTLLRIIKQTLEYRSDLSVGYMPQNYEELLDDTKTPTQFLAQTGDHDEIPRVRSFMGNMKFTSDEMEHPILELSGGSKAKLIFLNLVLQKHNVLLLDEPTRNVSPLSNPIIRTACKHYKGSIISVSHDRKFLDDVCDQIYELTETGLILISDFDERL